MDKPDLRSVGFEQLAEYLRARGEADYRAGQIFTWLYQRGVSSLDAMRNLPQGLRAGLADDFVLTDLSLADQRISADGTIKFLFDLPDHQQIETVLIPTPTRSTVCVSTQAGCKFACRFCASGIGGWQRNLSVGEILAQVLRAKNEAAQQKRPLSHIVFMGTGEPLDNYDAVLAAIRMINDPRGLNIGARRITISTCGLIPQIQRLAGEGLQVELSVSLHGYDDQTRGQLMPVNQKYPLRDLLAACRAYAGQTRRQVTFEYVLIRDLTCNPTGARILARLLRGWLCKVNLIPFNPVAEFSFVPPAAADARAFQRVLQEQGIPVTLRRARGQDVGAACGQLRHERGPVL